VILTSKWSPHLPLGELIAVGTSDRCLSIVDTRVLGVAQNSSVSELKNKKKKRELISWIKRNLKLKIITLLRFEQI